MFDFNDAEPQMGPVGELIPDGTFAKLKLKIRPGGVDGAVPADKGLLRPAGKSDAKMLDCELTVLTGPFARKKLWQNFTVAGGKLDPNGVSIAWKISKSTFRAMIESATGLDPKDMSDAAKQKRTIQALSQLQGIEFAARIMIEPGEPGYRDANRLANVVIRGEPQYEAIMRGELVDPDPINAQPKKPKPQTAAGGWQGGQAQETSNSWTSNPQTAPAQQSAAPAPAWLS